MKRPEFRLESTNDTRHYHVVSAEGTYICKIVYATSKDYWFVGKWGTHRRYETKEQAFEDVVSDTCSRFEHSVTGYIGQRAKQLGYDLREVTATIDAGYLKGFKTQEQ